MIVVALAICVHGAILLTAYPSGLTRDTEAIPGFLLVDCYV